MNVHIFFPIKGCNKAFELYNFRNNSESTDHLFIKTGYVQVKVFYDEILYLEATDNYVTFVLKDKNIISRSTFIEVVNLLPQNQFVRVHRSYLVAINKIDKVERHQVPIGTTKIPVNGASSQNLSGLFKK